MKKSSLLATAALLTAAIVVGCDQDKTTRTSSAARPPSRDNATPYNTAAPGLNPGSAVGAGQNLGTTASTRASINNNNNAPDNSLPHGSTAVSYSGAPGTNANTGTTPNPHYIEDTAAPAAAQYGLDPQQFVTHAGSAGLFEIQSSELALKKSTDPAIKNFAQQMITDHTKANDKLKTIATDEHISVSEHLLPKDQTLLNRLNLASNDFDKQYAQMQRQAHEDAVSLFQNASKNLTDPQLKDFATQTLPTLQQHLQHANQLPQ